MIKDICPNCEKITTLEFIHSQTTINVRGESILVEDQCFHCLECHETFEHPQSTHDVLELAYREYRLRHEISLCSNNLRTRPRKI